MFEQPEYFGFNGTTQEHATMVPHWELWVNWYDTQHFHVLIPELLIKILVAMLLLSNSLTNIKPLAST